MKDRKSSRRLLALFLALIMAASLMSGCGNNDSSAWEGGMPPDEASSDGADALSPERGDTITLCWDSERTIDPLFGTDPCNMAIADLMFEGLFTLGTDFTPVKCLCDTITTEDGITYTIKLLEGVKFSDGSSLTSLDVVYSYDRAMASDNEKYSDQLSPISDIRADENDDLTLTVVLNEKNYCLPALLTVPIVKYNTSGDSALGTGPYKLTAGSYRTYLTLSEYLRGKSEPTITTINLKEFANSDISAALESGKLDLYPASPSEGTGSKGNYISTYYNTSTLQYLGFNTSNAALADPAVRRAVGCAVDRSDIVNSLYSGHALSSALILSPALPYYDRRWETEAARSDLKTELALAGLKDRDGDGFLEYRPKNGSYEKVELRIVVNSDSTEKLRAAGMIASNLKSAGIDAALVSLEWNDFLKALQNGDYDIYYGETMLNADFDPSVILGGKLDYSGAGAGAELLISAFLASRETGTSEWTADAVTGTVKAAAAHALCSYVAEEAPVIPILYRQYAVYSARDGVTGLAPTADRVFSNAENWEIYK